MSPVAGRQARAKASRISLLPTVRMGMILNDSSSLNRQNASCPTFTTPSTMNRLIVPIVMTLLVQAIL